MAAAPKPARSVIRTAKMFQRPLSLRISDTAIAVIERLKEAPAYLLPTPARPRTDADCDRLRGDLCFKALSAEAG
jgi:hypothetical protein